MYCINKFYKREAGKMKIRKAILEDVAGIARVHVDSWRTTYAEIISADYLAGLSYENAERNWRRNMQNEQNTVFVVENEEGMIIGFADTSKRERNDTPNSTDLTSLYFLQEYQGLGLGKQLLQVLFRHYKVKGYDKVFVDVLEANKTRHFYEKYGAELVGNVQIKIGPDLLGESFYVWNSVDEVLVKLDGVSV